jgi:hypothetical protein
MNNWISLGAGIAAGFLVLAGLYFWIIKGDSTQSDIMLGCAASMAVLVGSTGFGDRKTCATKQD